MAMPAARLMGTAPRECFPQPCPRERGSGNTDTFVGLSPGSRALRVLTLRLGERRMPPSVHGEEKEEVTLGWGQSRMCRACP